MLKGDLTSTSIEDVLTTLANEPATGCLHLVDDEGEEALVYFKAGLVYAVSVPGQRPQLGARLISSNVLVPENLAEALEAQRTELQGWRLGELLVHLGFVEQDIIEAFVQEQVRDGFTDLLGWSTGRWRFRKNEKTREDVAPPTPVEELIQQAHARQETWSEIVAAVHGPNAVPMLAARGGEADIALDPDTWSLLCKIDGERTLAELARECGFTMLEAGAIVRTLVGASLVDVEEDLGPDDDATSPAPDASGEAQDQAAEADEDRPTDDEFPRLAALAAAFALGGGHAAEDAADAADAEDAEDTGPGDGGGSGASHDAVEIDLDGAPTQPDQLEAPTFEEDIPALTRVSEALAQVLGPARNGGQAASFVDPFYVPEEIRLRPPPKAEAKRAAPSEDELRRERIRQAAAAELAQAHAEAEATRKDREDHIADVVNLEARREAARRDSERRETERLENEEAARLENEEAARLEAEEAARLEAERLQAEEAARLEAEEAARLEAEEAARLEAEEAARLEAEEAARLEAEEAARLEAEEAARLEAEEAARLEAEEAARLEAERLEAERLQAEEAARLEAEEAARLEAEEAERLAAEEAARLEAARLGAEEAARLEAERLQAEEAARLEAEEAARLEAEEAERLAAEEAARLEAERLAAEEAARLEAERLAAEEAARLEAEEAERLAAEEAARLEVERLAAEEAVRAQEALREAGRLEAERLEAERAAAARAEAEQREQERLAYEAAQASAPQVDPHQLASASAMLSEFSRTGATTLQQEDDEQPPPDEVQEPEQPQPLVQRDLTDTASLLRELSSLGFEDEGPSGPPPAAPRAGSPQPRPVTTSAKKKRGLFGR